MSGQQQFHNSIATTLAASAGIGVTALTTTTAVFPLVTAPDFYMACLEPVGGGNIEIVKVTAVSGTSVTVEREQEGSTGAAYSAGDLIQVRNTAGSMDRVGQKTDLGSAFPFQASVVDSPTTVYIAPGGDDVTGDGSLGNPWATLYEALRQADYLRFASGGSLTIQCANGTYPMAAQLVFSHPQGEKITVTGTSGSLTFPTGINTGDYSTDREAPTVPPRGADELYNTAGSCPYSTSTGARNTLRDSDNSNNRALLQSQAGVVFEWTSDGDDEAKIDVRTAAQIFHANFAFPADTSGSRRGFFVQSGGQLKLTTVTINGSTRGIYGEAEAAIQLEEVAITGASVAFEVLRGSSVNVTGSASFLVQGSRFQGAILGNNAYFSAENGDVHISGCASLAILANRGASLSTTVAGSTWRFDGNVNGGVSLDTGVLLQVLGGVEVEGNVGDGISCETQSSVRASTFRAYGNTVGIDCGVNSSFRLAGVSIISNNATDGVTISRSGVVDGSTFIIENNGGNAITVESNGVFTGGTVTATGNTGRVFDAVDAGHCSLGNLTCDLTNLASPHLQAEGRTFVRAVAPGSGGVDAGIVYSPTFGTAAASPDLSAFVAQT